MKLIKFIVSILIGSLFIFSGILKLFPIEMLELDLGYHTGMPEWLSMIVARLLIGFELVLGFLLIIRFQERRTLKWAGAVLVFFSFYLIYLMIQFPGQDNCGCMGMIAPMSPLQSLLKNFGMLGLIVFLLAIKHSDIHPFLLRLQKGLIVFVAVGVSLPFVLNTIDWSKDEMRNSFQQSIQQNVLKGLKQKEKGTFVLAYISPHCIYCKMLARKWEWFKSRNQFETPMHVVFMGQKIETDIQEFLDQTGLSVSSYSDMNDVDFIQKTHGSLPSIYVVQEGIVVQKDNFISFNERNLQSLLSR
jgi:hypothetical protein